MKRPRIPLSVLVARDLWELGMVHCYCPLFCTLRQFGDPNRAEGIIKWQKAFLELGPKVATLRTSLANGPKGQRTPREKINRVCYQIELTTSFFVALSVSLYLQLERGLYEWAKVNATICQPVLKARCSHPYTQNVSFYTVTNYPHSPT
jgi:hypothetical protein